MQKFVVPCRVSPKDSSRKIFRANPRCVMQGKNKIVRTNVLSISLFILAFFVGIVLSTGSVGEANIQTGQVMMLCAVIMIVVLAISMPYSLSKYNSMMARVHIEALEDHIKGVTIDENDSYISFNVPYARVKKIEYDKKTLVIILVDGKRYQFDVFNNPRDVYKEIEEIRKENLGEEVVEEPKEDTRKELFKLW